MILSLKPEDEERILSEALKWFKARIGEIQFEVPLEDLSDDDLNTFLSDNEKREFMRYMNELTRGLITCSNVNEPSKDPLINATIALNLLKFEVDSILPIRNVGLLAKCVHQRKVAKAKQEQMERDEEERRRQEQAEHNRRRKQEEERWLAARKAVNPPLDDAKGCLKKEEYERFLQASLIAMEVYLEKGEKYLDDTRTFDYQWYLKKISDMKEEEKRKTAAISAVREFNQRLNKEKGRLKAFLSPSKKDHQSYFKKQTGDRNYIVQSFTQFLSNEERQSFDRIILNICRKKLDGIVSGDFRQFIENRYWRSYYLLPSAEYSLEGVPCLDFMFDVFAVVELRIWLKPRQKEFDNYVFNLPWSRGKGYAVLLQEPEFLGYHYLALTPDDLDSHVFWQSIPLSLVKLLLNGDVKPDGFNITAATNCMTTYKVPRFKELVNIPNEFADYLKNIGNIDEMTSMGILPKKIADIINNEPTKSKVEHTASPPEVKRRNSRKVRAFLLFDKGNRPSDPEIKSLGIKPKSAYRYYQEWKKTH